MRIFDPTTIELQGTNLVEASAGTGKTYAIACLYLRLLVEQDLLPEQLLVVTFTDAATQELRGRIRQRLRAALDVFAGAATDDSFLRDLAGNANGRGPARATAVDRLDRALKSFDLAAVFTIHGFCLRALQDHAFESGARYDTELTTDPEPLLQEVVDDFWRRSFFGSSAELLAYALGRKDSPATFLRFLKGKLANPQVEVEPSFTPEGIASVEARCRELFAELDRIWQREEGSIVSLLQGEKGLSRSAEWFRPDLLPPLFSRLEAFLAGGNPFALFEDFGKLCRSGVVAGTKKNGTPPEHPFFDRCEELKQGVEERYLALKWELLEFARNRFPALKEERNLRAFDDLLVELRQGLAGPGGEALAAGLCRRYRAALIDEFQDTDPVQFDIFRRLGGGDYPLFLIGDPKQAIYSFRGADIFAYLEARHEVAADRRFTMDRNWRSTPELIAGIERLFTSNPRPFLFDEIVYPLVHPGGREIPPLQLASGDEAPLQLWFTPSGGSFITIGEAEKILPPAVAAEIRHLLAAGRSGEARIGLRGVEPADIAVLVRSHRQAALVQSALRDLRIPAVVQSNESLFATREAKEVHAVIDAVANPGDEGRIRTALVTGLFGKNGDDLARLAEDERGWEGWLEWFRRDHDCWRHEGFMVMFRRLLGREEVRERTLGSDDGERRLTNYLHCAEVIHGAGQENRLGPEGLLAWFGDRIAEPPADEECQIRLESDAQAVRIVTVHVSKGLEYPVVFVPFAWGGVREAGESVSCHEGYRTIVDYGSPRQQERREAARREAMAENLRLLYVALTRAQVRCYLAWGRFRHAESSAPAYLFHGPDGSKEGDPVAATAAAVESLDDQALRQRLEALATAGEGAITLSALPTADAVAPLAPLPAADGTLDCRRFGGRIENDWRVASFTALSAHDGSVAELPDRDETRDGAGSLPQETPAGAGIFAFPRGARAGTFLHELFEELDFSGATTESIAGRVEKGLAKYRYEAHWQPVLVDLVEKVRRVPLASVAGSFTLADLRPRSWLTEFEFFFPLRFLAADSLRQVLSRWSPAVAATDLERIGRNLGFAPCRGMLRGFIDLVFEHEGRFYLGDWKSNHLGNRIEDYAPACLRAEMERHLYPLQYLLYTVAFNRYLGLRVPGYDYENRFGGVFYLFLRGVDPGAGERYGIFRDRPPRGLVEELTDLLIETGG